MHTHVKYNLDVTDAFLNKFAQKYIEQRSETTIDYESFDSSFLFSSMGFESTQLKGVITKSSVALDKSRQEGEQPTVLQDIYRSDLGELLMTYYFEEKIPQSDRFKIPLKNISNCELADLPGRGLDAIGYRLEKDKVHIFLGEAKVSGEKKSPPAVINTTKDSIYKTHIKHRDEKENLIRKLSDYCRKLNSADAEKIGFAILCMQKSLTEGYAITYGCTLIRDFECVDENNDYGKMKSNCSEFEPHRVFFSLMSFEGKNIIDTVNSFYSKVQAIISAA